VDRGLPFGGEGYFDNPHPAKKTIITKLKFGGTEHAGNLLFEQAKVPR
jgi:hypothetical protein